MEDYPVRELKGLRATMPLTQLENDLRLIARQRIAQGELPRDVPAGMWGGDGTDQPCSLCDKAIHRAELECEVEVKLNDLLRTFRFHILCHAMWEAECVRAAHLSGQAAKPTAL